MFDLIVETITGWWFGTFFIFPYIGNNHPNWLIFFRGGGPTTNQLSCFHSWVASCWRSISIKILQVLPPWHQDGAWLLPRARQAAPDVARGGDDLGGSRSRGWFPPVFFMGKPWTNHGISHGTKNGDFMGFPMGFSHGDFFVGVECGSNR